MPPLRRAVAGMDDADSACSGGVASSEDNDRRKAIAKLVDMGFAPEESRRALAEEAEDREAGGEPGAEALEESAAMTARLLCLLRAPAHWAPSHCLRCSS